MKRVANTLHNLAAAYSHYMVLRMQFRAKLLSRPVEREKLLPESSEQKPAQSACH